LRALEPANLRELGSLTGASGWGVLLTLGFGHFEPQAAAREAAVAKAALGSSLEAIEIGNEPDSYARHGLRAAPWTPEQYNEQVDAYRGAIEALAPGIPLAGPDPSGSSAYENWGLSEAIYQRPALLTGHHYPLGCAQHPAPTISLLLSPRIRELEERSLRRYVFIAQETEVPFRLDETNSVSCGGVPGISDTFASALWAVSYVTQAMSMGAAGINLQGNPTNCVGYTPICAPNGEAAATGKLEAQPDWYALLLAKALVGERPLRTIVGPAHRPNVVARAFGAADGTTQFVLVDDDPPGSRGAAMRLHVGAGFHGATVLSLTAPSPQALSGVKLGGGERQLEPAAGAAARGQHERCDHGRSRAQQRRAGHGRAEGLSARPLVPVESVLASARVRSVGDDRQEVASVRFQQLPGDPALTGHDRHGGRTALMMDVQVPRDPVRVDVELDRAHRAGEDQCGAEFGGQEVLACGPHELAAGGDPEAGARHGVASRDGSSPARDHAARGGRCDGAVIDQQLLVLQYREDPRVSARHAFVPRSDVGAPVGVGDDRREPRPERHRHVPARHEPDVVVAELEAAVERSDDVVNLARRYLIPVPPAGHAPVARARVQVEAKRSLLEAHERDAGSLGEPRDGPAVHARDGRPRCARVRRRAHLQRRHRVDGQRAWGNGRRAVSRALVGDARGVLGARRVRAARSGALEA
jgi:hypothetical protein